MTTEFEDIILAAVPPPSLEDFITMAGPVPDYTPTWQDLLALIDRTPIPSEPLALRWPVKIPSAWRKALFPGQKPKWEQFYDLGIDIERNYPRLGFHTRELPIHLVNEPALLSPRAQSGFLTIGQYTPPSPSVPQGQITLGSGAAPSTLPHEMLHHLRIMDPAYNYEVNRLWQWFSPFDYARLARYLGLDEMPKPQRDTILFREFPSYLFESQFPQAPLTFPSSYRVLDRLNRLLQQTP